MMRRNSCFLCMLWIVFLLLTACGNTSQNSGSTGHHPEKMEVNGKEVAYNQDVIDIVNRTDLPVPKLAIEPNQETEYVIKVEDETYKVMNISGVNSPIVQILNGEDIHHQFELSKSDFQKLKNLLEG